MASLLYTLGAPLAVFLMLFVCLFDLISSGYGKNENLWKSLGDKVVNRTPRELLSGLPREYIGGPLWIFFWQTLCRILGQTLGLALNAALGLPSENP